MAALREASASVPIAPLTSLETSCPTVQTKADRDAIVQLALSRRGEIIQAATAEQVFCLEVDAQGRIFLSPARTFASGGDIHATPLGVGSVRPGLSARAAGAGNVGDADRLRVIPAKNKAGAYHERAEALTEKTRNLIGLEAADAYLRWKQYDISAPKMEKAAQGLEDYSNDLSKNKFNPNKAGLSRHRRPPQRRLEDDAGTGGRQPRQFSPADGVGQPGARKRRRFRRRL